MTLRRPSAEELRAASGKRLKDVIGPDLAVLFCGINPGLYSAALGFHFARPGNRFWAALHKAGFTPDLLAPAHNDELLRHCCGLTDIVARATARADELTPSELRAGRLRLERKVMRHKPKWLAILGIGAYRIAFDRPRAVLGQQVERIGTAGIWVLPNPSGLNAAHQPADLARAFRKLRNAAFSLLFVGIARSAPAQALPADLVTLLAKARVEGPVAAWCRAEFQEGKAGAFAVASAGRYVAADPDGRATALGSYHGKPDLSCYSRPEAEKLDLTIRQSETIEGKINPRWNTTVVCGFLEDTAAECWQRNPKDGSFAKVGGWTT